MLSFRLFLLILVSIRSLSFLYYVLRTLITPLYFLSIFRHYLPLGAWHNGHGACFQGLKTHQQDGSELVGLVENLGMVGLP